MTEHNHNERDEISGVETTGHAWDGLKELNNPAPRWWLIVFLLCCIWSVGYWVVYPAWPTLSGSTKGSAGWTSKTKLAAEQKVITDRRGAFVEKLENASLDEIKTDPELYQFAIAGGRTMFQENCASCHGAGGQGGNGYPNLNDDDWIWGGSLDDIHTTIRDGVRSGHPDARGTAMPAFGKDGMLSQPEIKATAEYVLSLSTGKGGNEKGAELFANNCTACHGQDAKGNREMGAPDLTDAISLYGNDLASIQRQINNPHLGVMPTWKERLPEVTIKQLVLYVHELGGGEENKQ